MSEARTRFEDLRPVIDDSPKEELLTAVKEQPGGIDGVLGLVFELTPDSFKADKARKGEGTFQYEIDTPEGPKFYHVSVDHGTCAVGRGRLDSPKVTIGVELGDFLKMTTGKLAGPQAFMTGKLKVSGNTFFAMKWRDWFGTL
ncbi:SCP2 sterol-binding domain-containing protein [Nonomuraea sp. NPDC050783]|uniref:SCP2 sterol-binding domain-containing protein n=1 Tax=Nonomuraea sp. NPDC050783 TaxID=3154634 RepID=UPI003465D8A4